MLDLVGVDSPGLKNKSFNILEDANQVLQQSLQFNAQSLQQQNQTLLQNSESLRQASASIAAGKIAQAQANAQRASNFTDTLNSFTEQVGNYVNYETKRKLQEKETQIMEYKLRQEQERAQTKALSEAQYNEAYSALNDMYNIWRTSDWFRQKGVSTFKNDVIERLSTYDALNNEQIKNLTEMAYKFIDEQLDSQIEAQQKYAADTQRKKLDIIIANEQFKINATLGMLRHSAYTDVTPILEKVNSSINDFLTSKDNNLSELDKLTVVAKIQEKALENLDERNKAYAEIQQQLNAIRQYQPYLIEITRRLESRDGDLSPQQAKLLLQQKRLELGVPGGFEDIKPFESQELYKQYLSTEQQIRQLEEAQIIDQAKRIQMSNEAVGLLAIKFYQEPVLAAQMLAQPEFSSIPGIKEAARLAQDYPKLIQQRQEIAIKRNQVAIDIAELNKQGLQWLFSQKNRRQYDDILRTLQGYPTPQQGQTLTQEDYENYNRALGDIDERLKERLLLYDNQLQNIETQLRPYGLNIPPDKAKDILEKGTQRLNTELQKLTEIYQQTSVKQPSQPSLGIRSPFEMGGNESGNSLPKTESLYRYNHKGRKVVLPFSPSSSLRISGQYGEPRVNRKHAGLDFAAPEGTPLFSYVNGTVVRSNCNVFANSYGCTVDIKGDDGMIHRFAHLQKGSLLVKPGQRINAGDQFAKVGNTGRSTGPHLHWEIRDPNKPFGFAGTVDPLEYLANIESRDTVAKQPRGNKQGWTDYRQGESQPRIPNNALVLGNGLYILNGRLGRLGETTKPINLENVVKKNKLQSVIITDVNTGQVVYDFNSSNPPASPASTIKLIVADVASKAKLKPNETITITKDVVAEGSTLKPGQTLTVAQAFDLMLSKSDNTATNALIKKLGGTQNITQLAKKLGYTKTQIKNMLSLPGAVPFQNVSTAADTNKALVAIYKDSSELGKAAQRALSSSRDFSYKGSVANKIGNNSKVVGNVGLLTVGGKTYAISTYANRPGDESGKKYINDVMAQISNELEKSSTGLTPVAQIYNVANIVRTGSEKNTKPRGKNQPDAHYGYAYLQQNPRVARKLNDVADRLGIPGQWLADVIAFETGDFKQKHINGFNQTGKYGGLIGFGDALAKDLGLPSARVLISKSAEEQLEYVYKALSHPLLKPHLSKGIEYTAAAVFGRFGLMKKLLTNRQQAFKTGDGWINLEGYLKKLGRGVGRRYNTRASRQERLTNTTHTAYTDRCKVCEALRQANSFAPHESQLA